MNPFFEIMKITKPFFKNLALFLFSLILGLALMEVFVRLAIDETRWKFRDSTDNWVVDPIIGWSQKPNLNIATRFQGNRIDYITDPYGSQVIGPANSDVRIMIVGDSTAAGRSVPLSDRVHNQIYEIYKEKTGVEPYVANASVEGYSTDQSFLLLQRLIKIYRPTIVLHITCDNDYLQNSQSIAFDSSMLPKPLYLIEQNSLVLLKPVNLPRHITRFGSALPRMLQYSALYRVIHPLVLNLRKQIGADYNLIKENAGDNIYQNPEKYDKLIDWQLYKKILLNMKSLAEENNAKFYLYKHPSLEEIWPPYRSAIGVSEKNSSWIERRTIKISSEMGINYIKMNDYFLNSSNLGPFHLLPADSHANSVGYHLQATAIVDSLLKDKNAD